MKREAPHRIRVTEYVVAKGAVKEASAKLSLPLTQVVTDLIAAGNRLNRELAVGGNPIIIDGGDLHVCDVAGLVRVSPRFELEIAPKFLGQECTTWREDFFFLATLSRYGRILPREAIHAGVGERGDLATLVARAMVEMFWQNHRRPLRIYAETEWKDFAIDGDPDEEQIVLPDPEGFSQKGSMLTRANRFNRTILDAIESLLPEVHDVSTRQRLSKTGLALAPQPRIHQRHPRNCFPNRHRSWEPLYELAEQVLSGFGILLGSSSPVIAPGFAVHTAKLWENLVSRALRIGFGGQRVKQQKRFVLGRRGNKDVETTPDVAIESSENDVWIVSDAKYKGRVGENLSRIDSGDLYEGLAFLKAAKSKTLVLVYPEDRIGSKPSLSAGSCRKFDHVTIDDLNFVGVKAEVRGISRRGGLRDFAKGVSECLRENTLIEIERPT